MQLDCPVLLMWQGWYVGPWQPLRVWRLGALQVAKEQRHWRQVQQVKMSTTAIVEQVQQQPVQVVAQQERKQWALEVPPECLEWAQ